MASLSSLCGLRIGAMSCAVSQRQDHHHHDHHYLCSSPLSSRPSAWLAARMPHSSDGASAAVAAAVPATSSESPNPAASSNSRSRHGVLPRCLVAASALAAVALSWGGSALAHPSLLHQALDEENGAALVHILCSGVTTELAFPHAQSTWLSSAEAPPMEPPSADCVTIPPSSIPAPTTKRATLAEDVSNELIVAEAWQVVNERFLDARHHKWSPDAWANKKDEVLRRPIPSRMAAYSVIRNMLSELDDPYTRFITPKELKQLSKYDMTGIGISLGEIGESTKTPLRVVGIVFGSPAQLAGIKQGDEILSVDGIDVQGKSAFEASSLIQGVKGTLVSIEVKHGPCGEIQRFSIERQQSVQTPVYYHLEQRAGNVVGYMRVKEFNAVAKRDMVTAMDRLKAAGATSFLLDLRDNPGGLVQAGVEIAKAFLDKESTVVYTVGRDPGVQKQVIANGIPLTTAPLMVLVNDHTASASEIVAAALHDNCRAVLVGQRTFGKGLIQSVFELSDGSGVILTVGKYVTPRHQDIDGNGIEPDFRVLPNPTDAKQQIEKCSMS